VVDKKNLNKASKELTRRLAYQSLINDISEEIDKIIASRGK